MRRLGLVTLLLPLCCVLGCKTWPLFGEIATQTKVTPPKVDDSRFGESGSPPGVLEIKVDRKSRSPGGVGRKVKDIFFPNDGDLIFNVVFACGEPGLCRGRYADPTSIWFNVFFGYYQLDVPRSQWQRPFGYDLVPGQPAKVRKLDILRIGKADWNYFSNYMYGVPQEVIRRYNAIDEARVAFEYVGRVRIGQSDWDHVRLDGVEVVSAYVSGQDGQSLVVSDKVLTPLWRGLFGPSEPSDEYPRSFFPTRMKAEIYMAYRSGHDLDLGQEAYSTLMFGATVNADYPDAQQNQAFLEAQLAAIRSVMVAKFPRAGFAPAR